MATLFKTRGIVLSSVKFKETSIIVKVFTEDLGLQTYIVNGVRSSRGHSKIALYQPLVLLDLVVYKNEQKDIQRISECKCEFAYHSIPMDMKKSAVAMFWAEILNKTIREDGHPEREKFAYIRDSLIDLDRTTKGIDNYPISFPIGLCRYLGFEIESGTALSEDHFVGDPRTQAGLSAYFDQVLQGNVDQTCDPAVKRQALVCLINYYTEHFEGFGKVKSVSILKQLFS